jgi:protease-4
MLTHIKGRLQKIGKLAKKEASTLGKQVVRMGVTGLFLSFIALIALSAIMPKPKRIESGSTLYVEIDRPLTSSSPYDGTPQWQYLIGAKTLSAVSIATAIEQAAKDKRIERLILDLDGMAGTDFGPASLVRDAVMTFKAAGKPTSVYATGFDNAQYMIAAGADEILSHPDGSFTAGTIKAGGLYLGGAFERFGVNVIIGKAGRYKSAIEPYTRSDMSEDAREATERFLTGRLKAFEDATRKEAFGSLVFEDHLSDAEAAKKAGLVDELLDAPALTDFAFGNGDLTDYPFTSLGGYWGAKKKPDLCLAGYGPDEDGGEATMGPEKIGLVFLEGQIMRGESQPGVIGDVTVAAELRDLRRDQNVKALVVRVDSPGGDAVASEIIRSELAAFKATGRPVYISMGSVAASGGYWIASGATKIFAEPTTLTGSIGVFSMRTSGAGVLAGLGVTYDGVEIGRSRTYGTIVEPIGQGEEARLQAGVDRIYGDFTRLVSDARDLEMETAPEWAEGRVMSASEAIELRLIDAVGSLSEVMDEASQATNVPARCIQRGASRTRAGALIQEILTTFVPGNGIPIPDEYKAVERMMGPKPSFWAYCPQCQG